MVLQLQGNKVLMSLKNSDVIVANRLTDSPGCDGRSIPDIYSGLKIIIFLNRGTVANLGAIL